MILLFIIEFTLIFWAITYTTQIKISIKRILSFILIIICPTILIYQFIGQWQGIIFLIISSCIFFFWLSKSVLTFIHICFVLLIGILADNITQFITVALPYDVLPGLVVHYFLFSVLFIVIIIIYQLSTRKIYKWINEVKFAYILILFIVLVTMSTFYINIYLTDYLFKDTLLKFNIITQIIYFTIMIFVFYLTIITIKKETHYQKIKFETDEFTNYMHSLELINNDMQKFRHDYANILCTMQGYIEINDFEGLKKYFKKHIFSAEEDTLKRNNTLANLAKLRIMGIKGLILTKILQAEKEGILVNVEISDVIDEIDMNVIDLARIIGILFDNAIEANNDSNPQKEINVVFFKSISDSTIIIIENTLNDNSVMVEQIFTEGFSTKGKKRGKGLHTAKNIIDGYPNVMLNTNVCNGLFTQIIELMKNEGIQ